MIKDKKRKIAMNNEQNSGEIFYHVLPTKPHNAIKVFVVVEF